MPSKPEKDSINVETTKRKNQPESIDNHGGHLPDYQTMRKRCTYCAMEGKENRTIVICSACNIPLSLLKERNCLQSIKFRSTYNIYFIYIAALYIVIFSILCFECPKFAKEM